MFASAHLRIRKMRSICVVAVIAGALFAPAAQADQLPTGPKLVPPKANYLALGDSLAFGYQPGKSTDPAAYNTGYVDDFAAALAPLSPGITTVNYGCPGEWTDSFLGDAPCPYPLPLHDPYTGSQMAAADAFLSPHPSQTSPVTIDIGGNDALHVFNACKAEFLPDLDAVESCVAAQTPSTAAHIAQNLGTILAHLRADAPKTEIIVVGLYNVLVVLFGPDSDALAAELNSAMADTAAAYEARFADPLPVFNPPGPNEIATICTLTYICTAGDIHPTDAGYQAMANVVFEASGYSKLGD
jgi:lysophospholipase L1-like esterase